MEGLCLVSGTHGHQGLWQVTQDNRLCMARRLVHSDRSMYTECNFNDGEFRRELYIF